MEENKKNILVAVYGSLRIGLGNHHILTSNRAIYLGEIQSEPIFTMYSLGAYPCIVKEGNSSIVMEIYKVDSNTLKRLDQLEGYRENGSNTNHYDRIVIKTAFGPAYVYVYDSPPHTRIKVSTGDWVEFKAIKALQDVN